VVAPSGAFDDPGATLDLWTTDVVDVNGYSLHNTHGYIDLDYTDQMGGTSGACPVAAGVAALILSVNPMLTGRQAKQVLERSSLDLGVPGRDDEYGHGRVDARAAVELALTSRVDVNLDGRVDFRDFALMGRSWSGDDPATDIIPIERRDGKVDAHDLEALGDSWLTHFGRPSPPATPN
jgi:subtilisin family serine protease